MRTLFAVSVLAMTTSPAPAAGLVKGPGRLLFLARVEIEVTAALPE